LERRDRQKAESAAEALRKKDPEQLKKVIAALKSRLQKKGSPNTVQAATSPQLPFILLAVCLLIVASLWYFLKKGGTGDAVDPQSSSPQGATRTLSFAFTGTAREYFGIWIVNTLLRIVTLGIYSPWAKVRKRRYFYCNTILDGAPFDYLADPLAILKGWFIAGSFFGLYSLASRTSPLLALALMLVFFGVFPWVIVRSRIFSLRNSTHRNIRFGFTADYGEAYRVFLWWQLLVPFTLGLITPYLIYRQKRFLVEKSRYGTTQFSFNATPRQYYRMFLPVIILVPLAVGAFIGVGFLTGNPLLLAAFSALSSLAYLCAVVYVPMALTNLTWNSTSLGGHRFTCNLRLRDLLWIYFSNAIAVLFSLGLLAPWAAVRVARYRLGRISLSGVGGLDSVTASDDQEVGAAGEELGEMLGFDLGI
jgi:uncharacterized membrane protein YjgN (DUF898 family)